VGLCSSINHADVDPFNVATTLKHIPLNGIVQLDHKQYTAQANATNAVIKYETVPWPPEPSAMLRRMVALEGGEGGGGGGKKVFRKLTLRWHPDKFQHRWVGGRPVGSE
jgi:hypothetical protein